MSFHNVILAFWVVMLLFQTLDWISDPTLFAIILSNTNFFSYLYLFSQLCQLNTTTIHFSTIHLFLSLQAI